MWSVIRSVYAWILLSVIMLPLFPAAAVLAFLSTPFDRQRSGLRVFVSTWVSAYALLTPLYRFRIEARERLPQSQPYVLVANHESGLDTLCLLLLRTPARFLAESWIFRIPLAGRLTLACKHIPVRLGDRESGRRALAMARSALEERCPVAIFPEGRLSADAMGDFRPGAFVLAQRAGVAVVPVLIEGAGSAWRPGTMVVTGTHRVRIAILDPVGIDEVKTTAPETLAARVRERIEAARSAPVGQPPSLL